jgi:hypothetical protein
MPALGAEDDVLKPHPLGRTRVLHETRVVEDVNETFDAVLHARNKEPAAALTA